jgi:hypothetical protein
VTYPIPTAPEYLVEAWEDHLTENLEFKLSVQWHGDVYCVRVTVARSVLHYLHGDPALIHRDTVQQMIYQIDHNWDLFDAPTLRPYDPAKAVMAAYARAAQSVAAALKAANAATDAYLKATGAFYSAVVDWRTAGS